MLLLCTGSLQEGLVCSYSPISLAVHDVSVMGHDVTGKLSLFSTLLGLAKMAEWLTDYRVLCIPAFGATPLTCGYEGLSIVLFMYYLFVK